METCVDGNPYPVVTAVMLTPANGSDHHATMPLVHNLLERDLAPDVMLGDTGYRSGESIAACAELGVVLLTPVRDPHAPDAPDPWAPSSEDAPHRAPSPAARARGTAWAGRLHLQPHLQRGADVPCRPRPADERDHRRDPAVSIDVRWILLHRMHGAGALRVRGEARVDLAVHLKALSLNVKRAVQHRVEVLRARLAPAAADLSPA